MSASELQNYTFVGKYARWIPEKKRRETWRESIDRVMGMMYEKYPEVNGDIEWAYDMMFKKTSLWAPRERFNLVATQSLNIMLEFITAFLRTVTA